MNDRKPATIDPIFYPKPALERSGSALPLKLYERTTAHLQVSC